MKLGFGLEQTQSLVLSQNLLQSLNILAMPTLELREAIFKELQENPTLEIAKDRLEKKTYKNNSKNIYETNYHKTKSTADEYQNFLESIPDSNESLQSHLIKQLKLLSLNKTEMDFGELLIQNLDDAGFNIVDTSEILNLYNLKIHPKKINSTQAKKIIGYIQNLDPVGCCTNSSINSLQVQAKILFSEKSKSEKKYFYAIDLLENHCELFKLENKTKFFNQIKKINTEYKKLTFDNVKDILELISTLNPTPGSFFSNNKTIFAIPEVFIFKTNDGLKVEVNSIEIPTLQVSKIFTKKDSVNQSDKLKDTLQKANQFIESLNYRKEALLKVTTAISIYQKNFFESGIKYLAPLTQSELASELNLSDSTISRTVNGKYLQCDWGVFELKYFFSSKVFNFLNEKNHISKTAVKNAIKKIIDDEPKITDVKITEKLKLKGISISRRTVNKYRNEIKNKC